MSVSLRTDSHLCFCLITHRTAGSWWDGDVHELLLQAQRQGRAELAAPEEKGAGRGERLRQQQEEDGSSESGSEIQSDDNDDDDDDDDNCGGGGSGRMPRRRGVKVGPRPPAGIEGSEVLQWEL